MPKILTKEEVMKKYREKIREILSNYLTADHKVLLEFHEKMKIEENWASEKLTKRDEFEKKKNK